MGSSVRLPTPASQLGSILRKKKTKANQTQIKSKIGFEKAEGNRLKTYPEC